MKRPTNLMIFVYPVQLLLKERALERLAMTCTANCGQCEDLELCERLTNREKAMSGSVGGQKLVESSAERKAARKTRRVGK